MASGVVPEQHDRVEVVGLFARTHCGAAIDAGNAGYRTIGELVSGCRALQAGQAVPQVTAQGDIGATHVCW